MRHSQQDAIDAQVRYRSNFDPAWHPVLSAHEVEVGVWHMMSERGRCYGIVRIVVLGGERGYRAVTWAERSADRRLIGYYRTLRAAAMAAHRRFLDGHAGKGGPNGG